MRTCLLPVFVLVVTGCATPSDSPLAPPSASLAKAPSNPTGTFKFPLDDAALALRSDRLYSDGVRSVYANGVCGVSSTIYLDGSGDATMQTNNPQAANRKCAAYPRKMTLSYSDGVTETIATFMNLQALQTASFAIPIGTTVKRSFAINPTQTTRCDILAWTAERQGVPFGADSVLVTRVDASTWAVETQPYPNDRAYCTTNGQLYHMPVKFTIVSSRPLAG